MKLQIPPSERNRVRQLLSLSETSFDALEQAFATSAPSWNAEALANSLALPADFDKSVLPDVVTVLLSFYWLRVASEVSALEVANAVADAIKQDSEFAAAAVGDSFGQRLSKLLSFDHSLGVTAKAKFIAYQYPRHFQSARIITDARPVFGDAGEPPAAFVVLHTLKLDVREGERDEEIFMALDAEDLLQLKKAIERAINKEKGLREVLNRTGVCTLSREVVSDAKHG